MKRMILNKLKQAKEYKNKINDYAHMYFCAVIVMLIVSFALMSVQYKLVFLV